MRRVIEALELRAVRSAKVELDVLVSDAENSLQVYIEDITNIGELNHAYRRLEEIVGVLQVMQMHGAVLLARELNEVIKSLVDGNAERVDEAQEVVSRGILRLAEYINHVQAGKKDIPIVLLPLLNDLRASREAPLLSENVLFFPSIDAAELPSLTPEKINNYENWLRIVRSKYQKNLLQCVQGNNIADAAAQICKIFIHLHKSSVIEDAQRFWWVASAVAQAIAINGIEFGASVTSLLSSLDRQIKHMLQVGEEQFAKELPEGLLKNMLYYVAIADDRGRIVQQIKQAFSLHEQIPPEYKRAEIESQISSPNDEVMLAVSKAMLEDLVLVRDFVELYVHSGYEDKQHIENLYSRLRKVGDTLAMVGIDEYRDKVMHELAEVERIKSGQASDVELSLLSVSETILEVETCINNFISYRNSQHYQPANQFAKINSEEVARGAVDSEFQLAFQRFLSELIMMIERLKEELVARMKQLPAEDGELSASELSKRILSVVCVAQLDELVPLAEGIHNYISHDQLDRRLTEHAPELDSLADCVVAFQCYIEQIEADMPLAEEILEHCSDSLQVIRDAVSVAFTEVEEVVMSESEQVELEEDGLLESDALDSLRKEPSVELNGSSLSSNETEDDEVFVSSPDLELPDLNADEHFSAEPKFEDVGQFESNLATEDQVFVEEMNAAAEGGERSDSAMINPSLTDQEKVSEQSKPEIVKADADPEILDIFIEEAEGVIEELKNCVLVEGKIPPELSEVRRGFHTLKGSGRLAGAERLGEFSWAMEDLLNKVLTITFELSQSMIDFIGRAIDCADELVEQLKSRNESNDESDGLIKTAREMIDHGIFEPETHRPEAVHSARDPELSAIFSAEASEHLKVLRQAFDADSLMMKSKDDLDRALHTLKGSSRTAGADSVAELCAQLEKVLKSSSYEKKFTTQESNLLTDTIEIIEEGVKAYEAGDTDFSYDQNLLLRLQELERTHEDAESDLSESDYENDVLPGLIEDDDDLLTEDIVLESSEQDAVQLEDEVKQADDNSLDQQEVQVDAEEMVTDEVSSESDIEVTSNYIDEEGSTELDLNETRIEQHEVLIDFANERDHDLCEIFLEEADDILEGSQTYLQAWRKDYRDSDSVSGLRRLLHTLKGSSRMADINTIGKLSHAMESLVDAVADQKIDASEELFNLMQTTLDTFHAMLDVARAGDDVELFVEFLEKVKAASKGELSKVPEKLSSSPELNDSKVETVQETAQAEIESIVLNEYPEVMLEDEDVTVPITIDEPLSSVNSGKGERQVTSASSASRAAQSVKQQGPVEVVRVAGESLNEFVNSAGEVSILHSRLEELMGAYNFNLTELDQTVERLRDQLRKLDIETEKQILFKHANETDQDSNFDPLEMDRYSEMHQLSRSLGESVEDLRNIKDMLEESMRGSEELLAQQDKITNQLQHGLLRTRMVQFNDLDSRLNRIVRQTATQLDKQVELQISGGNSELDRGILDKMIAPLEHLLRNSISHGIEDVVSRKALGKPETGSIDIVVHREGSEIVIRLKDDGAGINIDKIKDKALSAGLIDAEQEITNEEACYLILHPGLSTADKVSQIAGRGVGMDVVDKEIRELGGSLKISSTEDKGSEFTMRLPFTLAVTQALLVKAGPETYALTLSGINGVIRVAGSELKTLYESEVPIYQYADQEYMLFHMGSLLEVGRPIIDDLDAMYPIILLSNNEKRVALHVEASIGNREIVIKSLSSPLVKGKGITGATVLGDGNVALIVDVPWIIRKAYSGKALSSVSHSSVVQTSKQPMVMVVDDSITIRKVTTKFLEKNQYLVETAKDGIDALQKLQKVMPDLILLDIEMPRMDGYELASHIRNDQALQNIPIIMITSRSGDKHRQKALEIGVQKYLGKPYNEAQLLEHIEEFVG